MAKSFEQFKEGEESQKPAEISEKKTAPESEPDVEYAERLSRLKSMGRVVGQDFDMAVQIGKERGWRYKFKPVNKIEVDPIDVKEKGLEYCFGVISHEGGHRKISRTDFIPKRVWKEMGFSFLMNAVEDPRVNNWVSDKYDGASEWLERVYAEDISPEERIEEKARKKMGYTPKHIQFGSEVIRYWHTGKFSKDLPEDVLEALNKTIKYAEIAYNTLPEKDPREDEIQEKAKMVYKIVYSNIWPEYQDLIDKAFEEEKARQILKDMIEKGEIDLPEEGKSNQEGEPLPLDEMPEDLKEALNKKIKEKLDGMTEEERKKFEEEIEGKTEGVLDDLEDDLNKELKGKLSEQPETAGEEKKRKEIEKENKEGLKERAKEIREAKQEVEKKLKEGRTEYDEALREVKPYIDKVAEDIMNLFITKRFPKFRTSFPGQKLRLKGAMDFQARGEYKELFERRMLAERKDYSFLLLVDLSGSMSGEKIRETFKGTVLFAEALNKVSSVLGGLKVAVFGFQDELIPYKDFKEELNDDLREKMSSMKREVENKGRHNKAKWNNDGFCVDEASKILENKGGDNQFLFVLSDGQPVPGEENRVQKYKDLDADEELRMVVRDISLKGKQRVLGIGLGAGTEHVADFYKSELPNIENIPNVNIRQLVEVLKQKLQELIK